MVPIERVSADPMLSMGPIDPTAPASARLLDSIQGNILKGHGRDHTVCLFFRFGPDPAPAREGLAELARRYVTTAGQQFREGERYKRTKLPGPLFGNLFLTAAGYRALGYSNERLMRYGEIGATSDDEQRGWDRLFLTGMAQADDLNDPPEADWEEPYRGQAIHAMLLLADDDERYLRRRAGQACDAIERFGTIVGTEQGHVLRDAKGRGIEHFGYADGISQPVFLTTEYPSQDDRKAWDPAAPLKLVLVPDPLAGPGAYGSFMVFRKLEQNVRGFVTAERQLAAALKLKGPAASLAGAMAIGRFRDGTPLILAQQAGAPVPANDFRHRGRDNGGFRCPFQAHTRKVNPRGDAAYDPEGQAEQRARRIARRGVPYGEWKADPGTVRDPSELPSGGVGLLFMCFQASIEEQFAVIQARWANGQSFPPPSRTGLDCLIGQPKDKKDQFEHRWPGAWGDNSVQKVPTAPFGGYVTLKGGECFFAPSPAFFASLGQPGRDRGEERVSATRLTLGAESGAVHDELRAVSLADSRATEERAMSVDPEELRKTISQLSAQELGALLQDTPFGLAFYLGQFILENNPYLPIEKIKLAPNPEKPSEPKITMSGQLKDFNATDRYELGKHGRIQGPHERPDTWYFSSKGRPQAMALENPDPKLEARNVVKSIEIEYLPEVDGGKQDGSPNLKPPHIIICYAGGNGS